VSVNDQKPIRAWRLIAEELSREFDSGKIHQLTIELDKALQEQTVGVRRVKRGRADTSAATA